MSSIYDKASLVLIPSGTKTSKVYSQKPTNGDGDFTFSRSTAATRVNASGNIEKETQNLLLQSNSFNTTWLDITLTKTSGQAGYDGTNDAWKLDCNAASSRLYQTSLSVSNVQTLSVYAKAGTLDYLGFIVAGAGAYAYFDIANGQLGATNVGTIDHKIESIGGGWYRCSIAYTGTTTAVRIYPAQGDNDTAQTSGNIYIQDAQLEQGLVARDYIETTTTAIYGGITDNVPRLDYTDSSCPALLLEPQRTNLVTQSEYLDSWTDSGTTTTLLSTKNPSGDAQSYVIASATSATNALRYDLTFSASTDYSYSLFLKAGTSEEVRIQIYDGNTFQRLAVNPLNDFAVVDQSGINSYSIEDYGSGWYRVVMNFTTTASASSGYLQIYPDRTGNLNNVEAWGAQVEAGSYATSYIPTYGSAVTRNAETNELLDMQTNSVTTSGAWTAFLDLSNEPDGAYDNDNSSFFYTYSGNKLNAIISARKYYGTYGEGNVRWYSNADSSTIGYRNSTNKKWVLICDGTNVKLYTDGALSYTYTATNSHNGLQSVQLLYGESNRTTTAYSKFLIFPTAITNQEAIDLTT